MLQWSDCRPKREVERISKAHSISGWSTRKIWLRSGGPVSYNSRWFVKSVLRKRDLWSVYERQPPPKCQRFVFNEELFHQASDCRDISLNAKHLVLLKNVRDKNQFPYLARQAYPDDSHSLYESYLDAIRRPHGYLILDFAQDTDNKLRFRTNVFPDKYPPIIYAAVNNVTHTIELL